MAEELEEFRDRQKKAEHECIQAYIKFEILVTSLFSKIVFEIFRPGNDLFLLIHHIQTLVCMNHSKRSLGSWALSSDRIQRRDANNWLGRKLCMVSIYARKCTVKFQAWWNLRSTRKLTSKLCSPKFQKAHSEVRKQFLCCLVTAKMIQKQYNTSRISW